MRRIVGAAFVLLLVLSACGGDDDDAASSTTTTAASKTTTSTTATSTTASAASKPLPKIKLTQLFRANQPIAMAIRTGHAGFYLAQKDGKVKYYETGKDPAKVVLDIGSEISTGNEQGLLGLTFSPDGSTMFISYTNTDGDTRIKSVNPETGARKQVFGIHQPFANHNGGNIRFGPDGQLWLGLGDGGSGGDPNGNGQNPDVLLAKIVHFDPANPKPAIYAMGVRNPWRWSFDRETGDLWIGDVGQDAWEEVDVIKVGTKAGVNLGWNLEEGTHPYHSLHGLEGALEPVYDYGHDVGQSVVGGFVYRGSKIDGLQGTYLFTDTYAAHLEALRANGAKYDHVDLGVDVPGGLVSSFGEDADGELYVLSLDGGVFRIDAA